MSHDQIHYSSLVLELATKQLGSDQREHVFTLQDFDILNELGRGAFGVVHRARSKIDGEVYVLKQIVVGGLTLPQQRHAVAEVLHLSRINHPNITRYYASFVEGRCLYIVMEHAARGDMQALLNRLRNKNRYLHEWVIWKFCRELLQGLQHIHKMHIIHRDLKTKNIFISDVVKIGDLGVSHLLTQEEQGVVSRAGTLLYFPPEMIQKKSYDYKADMWALGCVLHSLVTREHPFAGNSTKQVCASILNRAPPLLPEMYSEELQQFISVLLSKKPQDRPSAAEALAHVPKHVITGSLEPFGLQQISFSNNLNHRGGGATRAMGGSVSSRPTSASVQSTAGGPSQRGGQRRVAGVRDRNRNVGVGGGRVRPSTALPLSNHRSHRYIYTHIYHRNIHLH